MKKFVSFFICFLLLTGGMLAMALMIVNTPEPSKAPATQNVPEVEVQTALPAAHQVVVTAHGTVIPAREISLRGQVGGEIVSQNENLIEGGKVQAGDELLRIDPTDYRLAVTQQREVVANAQYQLALEEGRQTVAAEEWSLFENRIPATESGKDLALRKPHLANARASLEAAESRLDKAELDLTRTVVRAPFNAVVLSEQVDVGQVVNANGELAVLVDTDYFYVKASIPYTQLSWLRLPDAEGVGGSPAVVRMSGSEGSWSGRLVQLLSDVEEAGRMVRILVQVDNPLRIGSDDKPTGLPLLLRSYVEVELAGKELDQVYPVAYDSLRDNDAEAAGSSDHSATLWLLADDDTLEYRQVTIAHKTKTHVYVSGGLQPGERVVTSHLGVPLEGMKLKLADEGPTGALTAAIPSRERAQ